MILLKAVHINFIYNLHLSKTTVQINNKYSQINCLSSQSIFILSIQLHVQELVQIKFFKFQLKQLYHEQNTNFDADKLPAYQYLITLTNKMQNRNLTLLRIAKQESKLKLDPIPNVWIARQGTFNFHFVLFNLQAPYDGGYYHGVIQLNENYPFAAPKLIFYTPSGRFSTNTPICTTFTNYHPQAWSSAWNVKTMTMATISYMLGDQIGYGCISATNEQKKQLARKSLSFNMKDETFQRLFSDELKQQNFLVLQNNIRQEENNIQIAQSSQQNQDNQPIRRNDNLARGLAIGIVIIVCIMIAYFILK